MLVSQLKQLAEQSAPTVPELRDTQIGRAVGIVQRRSPVQACRSQAKSLIELWKGCVREVTPKRDTPDSSDRVSSSPTSTAGENKSQNVHQPQLKRRKTSANRSRGAGTVLELTERERKSVLSKLQHTLRATGTAAEPSDENTLLIDSISAECEAELWLWRHSSVPGQGVPTVSADACAGRRAYTTRARSILFNLRSNDSLREAVLHGNCSGITLARMTPEEMASKDLRDKREERKAYLAEAAQFREHCHHKVRTTLFTCDRCGSNDTEHYLLQVERADEAMSEFHNCLNCGAGWRVN